MSEGYLLGVRFSSLAKYDEKRDEIEHCSRRREWYDTDKMEGGSKKRADRFLSVSTSDTQIYSSPHVCLVTPPILFPNPTGSQIYALVTQAVLPMYIWDYVLHPRPRHSENRVYRIWWQLVLQDVTPKSL